MNQGYIKISRTIKDWGWYDDPNVLAVWIHILVDANWKESSVWHGEEIPRGTLITSVAKLASETGLTDKQIRICLDKLSKTGEIVKEGANKWTRITICNYALYQDRQECEGQTKGDEMANKGQTKGEQRATSKEYKEEYNTSDTKVSSYSIQEGKKEKKEEDTPVSSEKEPADFSLVLKLWNDSASRSIPKVRMLSPARKEKVKLRIKEMGGMEEAKKTLATCFKKISESDFCNGATGKWTATFDWFFENEKNWLKVLEGNYDNRKEKSQLEILAENVAKADAYYEQRYRGYGGASPYGNQEGGGPYGPDEQ